MQQFKVAFCQLQPKISMITLCIRCTTMCLPKNDLPQKCLQFSVVELPNSEALPLDICRQLQRVSGWIESNWMNLLN